MANSKRGTIPWQANRRPPTLLPTGLVSLEPGLLAFTGLDLAGGGLEMNGAADLEERRDALMGSCMLK